MTRPHDTDNAWQALDPLTRRAVIVGAASLSVVSAGKGLAGVLNKPKRLITPPVLPLRMRGLNLELSPGSLSPAIARELAGWGINTVRINFSTDIASYLAQGTTIERPTTSNPLAPYRRALAMLRLFTAECARLGVGVILGASAIYGRDKVNLEDSTGASFRAGVGRNLMQFWTAMAKELRDDPAIIAYDVLGEPNYTMRREADGAVWYEQIMPEAIRRIRAINPHIWIAVMPWPWGYAHRYSSMPVIDDPAILYSFHFYSPHSYTHQGIGNLLRGPRYPGRVSEHPGSQVQDWNKAALARAMQPAFDFARRNNVRLMTGEFGVTRWAPGRDRWIADVVSVLEDNGVDWMFHTYNTWNGWNPTFAPDAPGVSEYPTLFGGVNSPGHQTLLRYWRQNRLAHGA